MTSPGVFVVLILIAIVALIAFRGLKVPSGLASSSATHSNPSRGWFSLELAYLTLLIIGALLYNYSVSPTPATLAQIAPVSLSMGTTLILPAGTNLSLQKNASSSATTTPGASSLTRPPRATSASPSPTAPPLSTSTTMHLSSATAATLSGDTLISLNTGTELNLQCGTSIGGSTVNIASDMPVSLDKGTILILPSATTFFAQPASLANSTPARLLSSNIATLPAGTTAHLKADTPLVVKARATTVLSGILDFFGAFHYLIRALLPVQVGIFPLIIPWIGAIGAVTRGLSASIGESPSDPAATDQEAYNSPRWHLSRPVIGAAYGIVTYLVFLAALDPTQAFSAPKTNGSYGTYVAAFLVGYSDGTFAALMRRIAAVILAPGDDSGATTNNKSIQQTPPASNPAQAKTAQRQP